MKYYVYRHVDLVNNIPFYIGFGENSISDYEYSRAHEKKKRSIEWYEYIKIIENNYEVEIIYESDDCAEIANKEKEFIFLHGRLCDNSGTLVNKVIGGQSRIPRTLEQLNSTLEKLDRKPISVFNLLGNKIGDFDRIATAAEAANVPILSAKQNLLRGRGQAYGFRFFHTSKGLENLLPLKEWTINRHTPLFCKNVITGETILFESMSDASEKLKLPVGTIGNNLNGTTNLARNMYKFRYINKEEKIKQDE